MRFAIPVDARDVLRLAAPAMAQSLLETLVFLANRAMLGRYSSDSLAAMQICGPVIWSMLSILGAFSVGTVALVGRATGARDRALGGSVMRASFALAGIAGVASVVVGELALEPLLGAFTHAPAPVKDEARRYLQVALLAMPFFLVEHVAASGLIAAGNTRTPFVVAAFANAVAFGLAWVLIFGHFGVPALGARGAAIASAVAFSASALLLSGLVLRGKSGLTLRGRGGERDALRRVMRVSNAAFVEKIAQHAGFQSYVAMIGMLGGTAMAANQALVSIESICFLSADGFAIAAAALVAQRLGAQSRDGAARVAMLATGLAVLSLSAASVVFVVAPHALLTAFTNDAALVRAGLPCLLVAAIAEPFMGAAIVLGAALRGAGDTRTAFWVMLLCGVVVRVIATYVATFVLGLGLVGIWIGSTTDWVVRTGVLALAFRRGRWRTVTV